MKYILILLLSLCGPLCAGEVITIIASNSIPPYVMGREPVSKQLPGLQVELVNAALDIVGIKTTWKIMPNNRILIQYKLNTVDAALNLPSLSNEIQTFASKPILSYQNCVIGSNLLRNIWKEKAKELRILGYQTAEDKFAAVFGKDVLAKSKNYNEVPSQKTITYHSVTGRTDLVLSDSLIFSYYAQTYWPEQTKKLDLKCLHVIDSPRELGFKSKAVRDRFNKGLETIKKNGSYDRIHKKYLRIYSALANFESTYNYSLLPFAMR